jgi:hypothetical protein
MAVAASDCPPEDPCCHDSWPFDDFTPNDAIRTQVMEQLGRLVMGIGARTSIESMELRSGASSPLRSRSGA